MLLEMDDKLDYTQLLSCIYKQMYQLTELIITKLYKKEIYQIIV